MPNVYVAALTAQSAYVNNVFFAAYSGDTLVASGTTAGDAPLFLGTLAAGVYKVLITPPAWCVVELGRQQSLTVSGSTDNIFDVLVTQVSLGVPTDDHLCRCAGAFVDSFGRPLAQVTLNFSEKTLPALLFYNSGVTKAVLPAGVTVHTDRYGKAVVDLLRGAVYSVVLTGYENLARDVTIPDLSAASLPDVLFPTVAGVTYAENGVPLGASPSVSMLVGDTLTLTLASVYRSGLTAPGLVDVTMASADTDLLVISLTADSITLQAIAAGTTTVEVTRSEAQETKGVSIQPIPALYGTLSVTIT
jgi:hypothetical protein